MKARFKASYLSRNLLQCKYLPSGPSFSLSPFGDWIQSFDLFTVEFLGRLKLKNIYTLFKSPFRSHHAIHASSKNCFSRWFWQRTSPSQRLLLTRLVSIIFSFLPKEWVQAPQNPAKEWTDHHTIELVFFEAGDILCSYVNWYYCFT